MIKRNDLILMSAALFVVLIWFFISNMLKKSGEYVTVSYRGKEIEKISLNETGEYEVPCEDKKKFRFKIENGDVYCVYSECKDKICVRQGKINSVGQSIVCLPQQIVLVINGDNKEYDAVTD